MRDCLSYLKNYEFVGEMRKEAHQWTYTSSALCRLLFHLYQAVKTNQYKKNNERNLLKVCSWPTNDYDRKLGNGTNTKKNMKKQITEEHWERTLRNLGKCDSLK